jgi:hypothetical protein
MSTVDRILKFWFARPFVTWPGLPLPVTTPLEYLGPPAVKVAEAAQAGGEPEVEVEAVAAQEEAPRQAA